MNHKNKKILSYIISFVVIASAGVWVGSKFIHLGNVEFTDNARINRQIVPINSRVQGYIRDICFKEFQFVRKGDTLVVIDDADMRLNVARAHAEYANALAGRGVAGRSITSAAANVAVSDAAIEEAKAQMDMSAIDLRRYENLLEKDAVTRQQYDAALTDYHTKKSRYDMLVRQRNATSTTVDISRERMSQSDAGIKYARAQMEIAELNLSYTVILAPCDGFTSRKEIQVGQLVQPGQTLLDLVDANDVWVTANFKETQLKHIKEGDKVEIKVDAIPGVCFKGKVASLSSATGSALSLIPQDNSSGNFVKVRQRIPVRIEFLPSNSPDDMQALRAGMNVECFVRY